MPPKSTSGKPKYSEGEKILCFHGPLLYEAKCLSVDVRDTQIKYFVHYQGWNKNWDEWVSDARIMKFNAVGLQKQKELKEFYSKPGKKVKGLRKSELLNQEYPPPEALRRLESGASAAGPDVDGSGPAPAPAAVTAAKPAPAAAPHQEATQHQQQQQPQTPTQQMVSPIGQPHHAVKRVRGASAMESGEVSVSSAAASIGSGKRLRIQIELPRPLKLLLADDWDLVAKQKRLHLLPLPTGQTVIAILARFVAAQSTATGADDFERERLSEFAAGVQSYFNAVLATHLLYPNERQQCAGVTRGHRSVAPAGLYGCVHLVRMFVRMGDLLAQTKLDLKCLGSLLDLCDHLMLFLEKNLEAYTSIGQYEPPSPAIQPTA